MSLFNLGRTVTTRGIDRRMKEDIVFRAGVQQALADHANGNWGIISEDDAKMNDDALEAERNGEPTDSLFSAYNLDGTEIYIITECDRSITTILFPEEY